MAKLLSAKGLVGTKFEDYLTEVLDGEGSRQVGGRDFDGVKGNRWWEAKSGGYWDLLESNPKKLTNFKSDMFDWTTQDITQDDFTYLVTQKEDVRELIGVEVYWGNTEIGGHLLLHSGNEFSFGLNINTKYLNELKLPDFNWYIEKIIPCLKQQYHIGQYNFEVTN